MSAAEGKWPFGWFWFVWSLNNGIFIAYNNKQKQLLNYWEHFWILFAYEIGVCFPKSAWGVMFNTPCTVQNSIWLWDKPDQLALFIKYYSFACSWLYVMITNVERHLFKILRSFWAFNGKWVWIKGCFAAGADETAGKAGLELISVLLPGSCSYLKDKEKTAFAAIKLAK